MSGIGGYSDAEFEKAESRWDAEDELKAAGYGHLVPGYVPPPQEIPVGYIVKQTKWPEWYRVITPAGEVYAVNPSKPGCSCRDFKTRGKHRVCKHITLVRSWIDRLAAVDTKE
ncbi:MAG: hypothetical protein WC455_11615 [Dehalococcoidia bacterium]|jgi:hypothetical protein